MNPRERERKTTRTMNATNSTAAGAQPLDIQYCASTACSGGCCFVRPFLIASWSLLATSHVITALVAIPNLITALTKKTDPEALLRKARPFLLSMLLGFLFILYKIENMFSVFVGEDMFLTLGVMLCMVAGYLAQYISLRKYILLLQNQYGFQTGKMTFGKSFLHPSFSKYYLLCELLVKACIFFGIALKENLLSRIGFGLFAALDLMQVFVAIYYFTKVHNFIKGIIKSKTLDEQSTRKLKKLQTVCINVRAASVGGFFLAFILHLAISVWSLGVDFIEVFEIQILFCGSFGQLVQVVNAVRMSNRKVLPVVSTERDLGTSHEDAIELRREHYRVPQLGFSTLLD